MCAKRFADCGAKAVLYLSFLRLPRTSEKLAEMALRVFLSAAVSRPVSRTANAANGAEVTRGVSKAGRL